MVRAAVFLAEGYEEIEFTVIVDVLRRAEVHVDVVSIADDVSPVKGSRGILITPDKSLSDYDADCEGTELYDLLALPGGMQAAESFAASASVRKIYQQHNKQGKWVTAICASPIAFAAHDLNLGRRITNYPALEGRLEGKYQYCNDDVVIDGNMVTSRGPGTAFEFALTLVRLLCGAEKSNTIKGQMLLS